MHLAVVGGSVAQWVSTGLLVSTAALGGNLLPVDRIPLHTAFHQPSIVLMRLKYC